MRLIDADALIAQCEENAIVEWNNRVAPVSWADAEEEFAERLYEAPVIDAVPVVHGRWVDNMCRDWRCSECGEKIRKVRNVDGYCYDDKPNYCPNCGAKMDGDE